MTPHVVRGTYFQVGRRRAFLTGELAPTYRGLVLGGEAGQDDRVAFHGELVAQCPHAHDDAESAMRCAAAIAHHATLPGEVVQQWLDDQQYADRPRWRGAIATSTEPEHVERRERALERAQQRHLELVAALDATFAYLESHR